MMENAIHFHKRKYAAVHDNDGRLQVGLVHSDRHFTLRYHKEIYSTSPLL